MRSGEWPLVSIVTPSYNQGAFISETIASVKNQDYPNIEHIVVDGESTDSTIEILKKHEGTYNMRWVSEPDKGQSDAVNKGFAAAQGEIIGWLNSDDCYLDRQSVWSVVKIFEKRPSVDVVYGDVVHVNAKGTVLRVQVLPRFSYKRLLRSCFIEQPAVFVRRRVVEKHELDTNLDYALDYEYWLRIAREFQFYHFRRVVAADRNHSARKILACPERLQEEVYAIQSSYAIDQSFLNRSLLILSVPFSSLVRRLIGVAVFLRLQRKHDFAFEVHIGDVIRGVKNQLFGWSIARLLEDKDD